MTARETRIEQFLPGFGIQFSLSLNEVSLSHPVVAQELCPVQEERSEGGIIKRPS